MKKGISYSDVTAWVGQAEKDIGSRIHIMVYTLDDGSQVLLGFPGFDKMLYAKHRPKDGKTVDLVEVGYDPSGLLFDAQRKVARIGTASSGSSRTEGRL